MIQLAEKLSNCECDEEMTTKLISNAHSICSRALELLGEFSVSFHLTALSLGC